MAANKITLKLPAIKLSELLNGLVGLDGATGDRERSPYKFSAGFRLRNGRNVFKVKEVLHVYEAERRKLSMRLPIVADEKVKTKAEKELEREVQLEIIDLGNEPHEMELETSTEHELGLEKNPIPVSVLGCIAPLIEMEDSD